jgi:thioredoxin-like negative regulator of GroEL
LTCYRLDREFGLDRLIRVVKTIAGCDDCYTHQLAVKGIPTMMVYKSGVMVSTDTGKLPKERVEEILKSAAAL